MSQATLRELLVEHGEDLRRMLAREGSGLLRFESVEDLVQGVHVRALVGEEEFVFQGPSEFRVWLRTIARRHVASRHEYWSAMKRGSGRVLRLTFGASSTADAGAVPVPPGALTGPSTFASRREVLVLCARALAALPERDQKLVRWRSDGVPVEEQAGHLEIDYAAAQRAGLRALERFRKAFEVASRSAR
ncbi:MAG: hypothetical protein GY711_35390 [bacterium]|nr:hypothetical protein [bacterium]